MSISVIIPTYQHADTIQDCLEHLFAQTRAPDEIIVVNDGSTDKTEEVLSPYLDRITLINQANAGANPARNRGFAASSGDRVIFCDADVMMKPHMLETLSGVLNTHPDASYAYCGFYFGWKRFASAPFDAEQLQQRNYIHTSALIRREHFPGFDPDIKRLQDWDVWLTMLAEGHTGVFVDEVLFDVRMVHGREGISEWQPRIFHYVPWPIFGWTPASIRKYRDAAAVIQKKHHLV